MRTVSLTHLGCALFLISLFFSAADCARAQSEPTAIALSGDPMPDGNGTMTNFSFPSINNAGQVALQARLTTTDNDIFNRLGFTLGTEPIWFN